MRSVIRAMVAIIAIDFVAVMAMVAGGCTSALPVPYTAQCGGADLTWTIITMAIVCLCLVVVVIGLSMYRERHLTYEEGVEFYRGKPTGRQLPFAKEA